MLLESFSHTTWIPQTSSDSSEEDLTLAFLELYRRLLTLPARSNSCQKTREIYNLLRSLARVPCTKEESQRVLANLQQARVLEALRSIYQEIQFNSELDLIPV
jgi:ATP adenylyltransferase/5',5'''-P-1,P-4-tetraphosphate phosphorylase II